MNKSQKRNKAFSGPLQSMTGYGRVEETACFDSKNYHWIWEIRSLNSRGLDIKLRIPSGLEQMDIDIRKSVGREFSRGSISINLQLQADREASRLRVNDETLNSMLQQISAIQEKIECAPPQAEQILCLRGVIEEIDTEATDQSQKQLTEKLLESFQLALSELRQSRANEGKQLKETLLAQLDEIQNLTDQAVRAAKDEPQYLKARLQAQLQELLDNEFSDDRVAMEAAALAVKADIREELDRLAAHIHSARTLISEQRAIGRRFDFLTQEFNREANTLCSKAQTMELKNIGLALKATIDQMREQVQNIE